ncbi:recombinase family protein [Paraburkholderia solitsugae]|uniref:recombinase family protein n=1 Tax=Paraburkholderia solitsugae TaxID=2675748 RepID=UPI0038B2521F
MICYSRFHLRTLRPGLQTALEVLRAGDTLVAWKLDRPGRSIKGDGCPSPRDLKFQSPNTHFPRGPLHALSTKTSFRIRHFAHRHADCFCSNPENRTP